MQPAPTATHITAGQACRCGRWWVTASLEAMCAQGRHVPEEDHPWRPAESAPTQDARP